MGLSADKSAPLLLPPAPSSAPCDPSEFLERAETKRPQGRLKTKECRGTSRGLLPSTPRGLARVVTNFSFAVPVGNAKHFLWLLEASLIHFEQQILFSVV